MPPTSAEHDSLFGLTALELGFVTQEQLAGATAEAGSFDQSLREKLCAMNLLTNADADAIAAVVRQRAARGGSDRDQTLDTVSAIPTAAFGAVENCYGTESGDHLATHDDRFVTQAPQAWSFSPRSQRFTILRFYRQGGLGRLMIAKDEELSREIALKEILPTYADSDESRRRFIREAEITGALEHPGIVPVYSLGEFPDGRPYYAMRFIRGIDLRMAIEDFHKLPPGAEKQVAFHELLARFVTVCQAVDYAHSRGVIHRDIKPSNIMLGDYGETLVVDWGLAKTMDDRSAPPNVDVQAVTPSDRAQSDQTQAGRIVGTAQYMSPEQAAGRVDLLAPACDIYGLGATLYHVITGRAPFEGDEDTVLRVQRGQFAPPREYARHLPRSLEAICLKAMARRPEDRYATARELALDLQRYLADERVLAYAEPVTVRGWRWVRRHRTLVTSFAATMLVAVVGLLVGVGLLKTQRDRAERNFQLAQDAVREYYIRVSEETLLNQPGMQPLRDSLLRQALAYYEQFLNERGDDASLAREVALANFFVGRISEAVDSPAKALPQYEKAAQQQKQLLDRAANGRSRDALKEEYAQTVNAEGRALQNLQRLDQARQCYEQAAKLREELAAAHPEDAELARGLASSVMNLGLLELIAGKPAAALPRLERAQGLRLAHAEGEAGGSPKLHRDLGMGYYNLAQAHLQNGDAAAAEKNLLAAIGAFESLIVESPADFEQQRRLAICRRMLGDAKAAAGDSEAAIRAYEQARKTLGDVVARNPNVAEYAADFAGVRMNLAQQLRLSGDQDAALEELEAATDSLRKLVERNAAVPRHRSDLGVALRAEGELLATLKRRDEARTALEESKQVFENLVREHPQVPTYATELKLTSDVLAELNAI
jgi:serine/threonine-protein kinase